MSTSPVTPPAGGTTNPTNELPTAQSLNNMFLQLLVAQLQNQDPTDPVDPSTFVAQLAQFSELSEVTSIYTLLQTVVPGSTATGGIATPASGSSDAAAAPANSAASAILPAGVSPAATPASNFAAPNISALTGAIPGKILGAF
ncbi:MAG: flagellar hook capping FlgD N-terminal domain-containing protein [Candidatus Sulfotelmatobacter sp.]